MGILANNEGKILRSNISGKVLKQNYNFGNAYTNDLYVQISYTFPSNWTQIFWNQYLNTTRATTLLTNGYDLEGRDDLSFIINGGGLGGPSKSALLLDNNRGLHLYDNSTSALGDFDVNRARDYIRVYGYNLCKTPEFIHYDRNISENEYIYYFNNTLGSVPLIQDYSILLKFNKAEILDFSDIQDGSDMRVGIRNHGSVINAHGEIIGLPVGTLQEQLDYANANLFETW